MLALTLKLHNTPTNRYHQAFIRTHLKAAKWPHNWFSNIHKYKVNKDDTGYLEMLI